MEHRDRIRLRNMIFSACHGVSPFEKENPVRIEVDLEIVADLSVSSRTDALDDTVDYAWAVHEVGKVVEGPSCNLIETLAREILRCRCRRMTPRKRCAHPGFFSLLPVPRQVRRKVGESRPKIR